ncbi:MAG: hypothetical protein ACPHL6_13080, partial [Rubripirellula sp.]
MKLKYNKALVIITLTLFLTGNLVAGEKLKVFILAGQSNTVGHARAHTIATLYKSGKPGDAELLKMVFNDADLTSTIDTQLTRARKIDELTGGISMDKIKNLPDGPEKEALQVQVDKLLEAHNAYAQSVIDACAVS